MKTYILNKREKQIEVYETVFVPKNTRPTFYGGDTICSYNGNISTYFPRFSRAHNQVEAVLKGNRSNSPYYGGRTLGDNFQVIEKSQIKSHLTYLTA